MLPRKSNWIFILPLKFKIDKLTVSPPISPN